MSDKRLTLGESEELILLAIGRLGENAYGVTVRDALERATDRDFSYGALYTTLDRLEKKGYVSSWMGEPTAERGGRAKKFYRVEASGKLALSEAERSRNNVRELMLQPGGGMR